jgi:hypothetical protein
MQSFMLVSTSLLIALLSVTCTLANENDTTRRLSKSPYRRKKQRNSSSKFADVIPKRNLVFDMMQLSADIFKVTKDKTPEEAISNPKFKLEHWIEAKVSTTAMMVSFQKQAEGKTGNITVPVVVFRGSKDLDDYSVDMNIIKEKSRFTNAPSDVKLHKGFQDALFDQGVVQDIENMILNKITGNDGEIFLTGHSLG